MGQLEKVFHQRTRQDQVSHGELVACKGSWFCWTIDRRCFPEWRFKLKISRLQKKLGQFFIYDLDSFAEGAAMSSRLGYVMGMFVTSDGFGSLEFITAPALIFAWDLVVIVKFLFFSSSSPFNLETHFLKFVHFLRNFAAPISYAKWIGKHQKCIFLESLNFRFNGSKIFFMILLFL